LKRLKVHIRLRWIGWCDARIIEAVKAANKKEKKVDWHFLD
jgi:hypothetical protein